MWRFPFSSVEVSDPLPGEKGADGVGDCGFVLLFPKFISSLATSSRDSAAKCKSVDRENDIEFLQLNMQIAQTAK